MTTKRTFQLIGAILIAELAGIVGSLFTTPAIPTWYAGLQKSAVNPPSWIFGPVWTTLFATMGIALFLVFKKEGIEKNEKRRAYIIFGIQLALNTLWSILFFGLQNPGAALIEIIVLWGAILATIIVFARISRAAALLLVPYLLWVSFAIYLNYAIFTLNR